MVQKKSRQGNARRTVRRQLIIEHLDARLPLAIETQLVKDINSQPENQGSDPTNFVQIGSSLYFAASTNGAGVELWKSDGTAAGTMMVKDIRGGRSGSSPFKLTNVNGTLYFFANDGINGIELWKSDGTDTGTAMVKDIQIGSLSSISSNLSELTNVNGTLYFQANDGTSGVELWKSDGTTAGTSMVKDIGTSSISSSPSLLTNVNGTLFFQANDGSLGRELWKSDGTSVGTVLVKDIRSGSFGASPGSLTNVNGTLFFRADNGANGYELWKSDGTNAGTVMVKNLAGASSAYPQELTNVSGALYFFVSGTLYKSDGTDGGTTLVKSGFNVDSSPLQRSLKLTNINGTLYFRGNDGTNGYELWKSDGTTVGTTMVKDIQAGNSGISNLANFTNVNGDVFFQANDGTTGTELWKSNGTANGTVRVKDIRPGATSSFPTSFSPFTRNVPINFNGTIYFSANDGVSGYELWKSDGTQAGTEMVKNIREGTGSATPRSLTNVNGTIYFQATNQTNGVELWKSDGTAAGTVMVKDIIAGANGNGPFNLTNVNGSLFFATHDGINGLELWKSDGSASGTQMVRDINVGSGSSEPASLTNVNGTLYFSADDGSGGRFVADELWRSDGTFAGTVIVRDIKAFSSYPKYLTNVNGTLYFRATEGSNGYELWKSNGTTAGTVIVKDIRPGLNGSRPKLLTNVAGTLFFISNDGTSGYELWKSDGTTAGTVMVKDVSVGSPSSNPSRLTNINGILYFQATNGTNGYELWRSDGTASGTFMLKDIRVGTPSSAPLSFTEVNGTVFFSAHDGANGYELWKSDGTSTGTILVRDILPGSNGSAPKFLTNFNGTLYFSADEGNGFTLWKSDGTDAGTRSLSELVPRESIFDPNNLLAMGGTLYYTTLHSDFGDELWKLFEIANRAPTDIALSSAQISENEGANTMIGTLSTTDPDAGDTFTYTLVTGSGDNDNAAFTINGSTLRATNSFDFETKSSYTVRVRSTDQGGLFTEKAFTITVTNVNETPTDIDLTPRNLTENAGANATVGTLSSTDPDIGATFTYTLVTGAGDNDNSDFNISGSSLRATNSFDFETKSSYTVRVRSTDQGGLFIEKAFTIAVTDVNETPIDIDLLPKSIPENAGENATVGALTSTDPDVGNTFAYTLVAGTGDTDNAAFNISGSSLRTTSSFDFETKSSYTVRVRSTDQGGLFIEKVFTIAVTDVNESPTDIDLSPKSIAENVGANATVGTLSTFEQDAGDTFAYTLAAGSGDADNASFNILGATLRAINSFDFETKSSYTVRVRSTDQGGLFTEKAFAIAVADVNESPADIDLSNQTIEENAGANAMVGTMSSTDPDTGNTFSYSLAVGLGDTDNAAFNISGSTLRATNGFDFETKSSYTVRVRSTDQGGLFTEKALTIAVTNVNETPTDIDLLPKSIAENPGADATVGVLTTTDQDAGSSFTYSLVAGTGDDDNSDFSISGLTLRAMNSFNFETKSSYTIRVRSTDQGGLFIEKPLTITVINVNESPTDIDISSNTIAENAGAFAIIGTLTTTDPDAGNTFSYTLVNGSGSTDNVFFAVAGDHLRANTSFDFESKRNYAIRVRATDVGGLVFEKTFSIKVTDINEAPSLQLTNIVTSVAESNSTGIDVADVLIEDDALGTNVISLKGPDADMFEVIGGKLKLKPSNLDFESKPVLRATVAVDDPSVGATPDSSMDLVISIANVPEVTGVIVIDGNGWLDSVRRVRVQWDMAVQLTNSALRWNKADVENANVSFTTQTSVINGRTVADMQFVGKYSDEIGLLNGDYQLTVMGDHVTAVNSSLAGVSFADRFLALRPASPFEMRIDLPSPVGIGISSTMNVQLVGVNEVGNGIRYQFDWNSDGIVDWTGLGGSSISIDNVSFASGGSRTIRGEAMRSGQSIAKGSKVVDVVPFTKLGSNWFSTLDVDLDNTISPLDVLRVVNRLNDSSPSTPYELRLDVDRDQSISPLDVLAIINHINANPNSEPPTPFASISMTDTGVSDGLTSNLSVSGVVKDPSSKLFASLDGKARREVVGAIASNGHFNVTDAAMVLLFGDNLDGDHLLTLDTVDTNGRRQAMDRQFTRISRIPSAFEIVTAVQNGGLSLAWTTAGNGLRYRVFRNVGGQSPQLVADGISDLATQVNLPAGLNELFVEAYDHIGNKSNSQTLRVQIS